MDTLRLPAALEASERVLIAGAGGGFDVYAGLPIYARLRALGKQVFLANLSFSYLANTDARRLTRALYAVESSTPGADGYFPERTLARFLSMRGDPVTVYAFDKVGVAPVREGYEHLAMELGLDAIVLVDGGTDILMRGDETGLGTPAEDATSLAAVSRVAVPTRIVTCVGFGIDSYHGVSHANWLENVAALAADAGFLGATALVDRMPEVRLYLDAVTHAERETPNRPSIVNGSVASAIEGRFGDHHRTTRTGGSALFINPLMSLLWAFDLAAVARHNLYLDQLFDTETVWDVQLAIEAFHAVAGRRARAPIPHCAHGIALAPDVDCVVVNGSRSANLVHLLVSFETGLSTRDGVSDWVYAEIERHDELSGALLELTTLHGKDDLEVAHLLRSLVPSTTREPCARRELAALGDLLSAGRVAARAAVARPRRRHRFPVTPGAPARRQFPLEPAPQLPHHLPMRALWFLPSALLVACSTSSAVPSPDAGADAGADAAADTGGPDASVGAPTGAACLPYQELSPTFQGFSTKQLVLDTNDPACASGVCLVNHFQGRASCPYGQDLNGNGVAGTPGCTVPGSGVAVGPDGGSSGEDRIVQPQCTDRTAAVTVTCSCRCANAVGETNDGASYCTCPTGTTCSQVVPEIMSGDPLAGGYCVPPASDYDASSDCVTTCAPGSAPCAAVDASAPPSASGQSTTYFVEPINFDTAECLGTTLPTDASGEAACQVFFLLPTGSACASDSGLSSVDATVAAAIVAGSRAPGPMTVCLLAQLPAAPCASSSQPGWCYLAGANAPDGCATSIGESPSTMALPSGAFAALACP